MNVPESDQSKPAMPDENYTIPAEGSLGLLALGARGIDLWRKKKAELIQQQQSVSKNTDQQDEKK